VARCVHCVGNVACWLFKVGGFMGGVNGQLNKKVVLARVLFGNELPFFVDGLYEEKFVWG